MRISAGMVTFDRGPGRNFLGQTFKNLDRSGWFSAPEIESFWLVDSGSPFDYFEREIDAYLGMVKIDVTSLSRTLNANAARMIHLVTSVDADIALFMQDDIDVCDRFAQSVSSWVQDHYDPKWLLYSFGTTWPEIHRSSLIGLTSSLYPIQQFYGAQCYAMAMDHARDFSAWFETHWPKLSRDSKGRNVYDDILIHRWSETRDPRATHFLASAPSFVQHTGRYSSIRGKFFEFPSWPGPHWSYQGKRVAV